MSLVITCYKRYAFKLSVNSPLLISFVRRSENDIYTYCLFFILWIPIKKKQETVEIIILRNFADYHEMTFNYIDLHLDRITFILQFICSMNKGNIRACYFEH